MKELTLSQIWIYPIKSLGGMRLTTSLVMPKGLQYDRRWMLVDENGAFMTQRVYPKMALFKVTLEPTQLVITFKGSACTLPFNHPMIQPPRSVLIWNDSILAHEIGEDYNTWFSDLLEKKCKLVSFPEGNERPVNPKYVENENVSLADGYPFLIIGQHSLDDLNSRLPEPLPVNRFRPNFVFTGGDPYEEDTWQDFRIGNNRFKGVKPCERCVLPTVNQDTAEKGIEPLKTLSTYRKRDNKIYLGQNVIAIDHDTVSIGDSILLT